MESAPAPARSAIVDLPSAGCSDHTPVHVTAHGESTGAIVWGTPVPGAPQRFRLEGLGPWTYWVRSHDDRSGNSALEAAACSAYIRVLDTNAGVVVLDRSDAVIDRPDFAGAHATVTAFRSNTELASATLDDTGHATIALSQGTTSGTTFCLRLDTPDRCTITFARAGEVASPKLYAGREREIEASCGTCQAPAPSPN